MKTLQSLIGNFKFYLILSVLFSCFSNKNENEEIIKENINIFLSSSDEYFIDKQIVSKKTINIIQEVLINNEDLPISKKGLIKKFNLKDTSQPYTFKINLDENTISNQHIKLNHKTLVEDSILNVVFYNLVFDKEFNYSCISVSKSSRLMQTVEIYFFKKVNHKWEFLNKRIIERHIY